jgi:peptidoglycan hydrolase-like protein with peptidoglycan-binding domain
LDDGQRSKQPVLNGSTSAGHVQISPACRASYPYDYYGGDYPYNYEQDNNDNDSAYAPDQYTNNPTVSAVQSGLAKLGYYRGAIDGVEGDETQAALARYQQDHDLSVTGTLTAATLQSLGLKQTAASENSISSP